MRVTVVVGMDTVYELPEHARIRYEWSEEERIDVYPDREDERRLVLYTTVGGIAALSEVSNMLTVQRVDRSRVLQGPRLADPETVARDIELSCSNALHGFNKAAGAAERLQKLADTLIAYAKHIREENNGTER